MEDFLNKNLFKYNRRLSIPVKIGDIELGGNNPIRIQSMTTTDTMDTEATVNQSIRMINAGCELVRVTAPTIKDAKNLKNIKDELNNETRTWSYDYVMHTTTGKEVLVDEKEVTDPDNNVTTYHYNDSGFLTSVESATN